MRPRAYIDRLFALGECLADRFRRPRRPATAKLGVEALEDRTVPSRPLPLPTIYTGTGQGPPPVVRAFDAVTGNLNFERTVADPAFTGGVRTATADFTRDGFPDILTGLGPGGSSLIQVIDGKTGQPVAGKLGGFLAYDPAFTGGVQVAAGDVDGDGLPDVITAAGAGGGPHVEVFSGKDGSLIRSFFAFEPDFRGGVSIAAADLNHDGRADLVVGAGAGGGPRVRVFDLTTSKPLPGSLADFFAFDPAFRGGVAVAADNMAGDVDGDGTPDVVVGTGAGGPSAVEVYSGRTGQVIRDFAPFGPAMTAGVSLAVAYVDDDEFGDLIVGTGPGTPSTVRVFSGRTLAPVDLPTAEFQPFGAQALGGVNLAATNDPIQPQMQQPQANPNPAYAGSSVTYSVLIYGGIDQATQQILWPTGTVAFSATDTATGTQYQLGTGTLSPGTPSGFSTTSVTSSVLPAGSYTLTAAYSGDGNFYSATSAASVQVWGGMSPPPPPSPPTSPPPPPPGPPEVSFYWSPGSVPENDGSTR